jgi:hypothetical protein
MSNPTQGSKIRTHIKTAAFPAACVLLAGLLSGCTAIVAGGSAGAASAGVEYTLTGVAHRTVNADLTASKRAASKALKQLGMNPSGPVNTEKGAKIAALTPKLNITVELERITSKATRISVDVKAGVVRKDKATAAEIIRRTVSNLGIK